jgi:DNA-binding transcriptional MerR regulator
MPVTEERLRVEDLARRADLSIDTIRFYQKRRLLPAPEREGRIAWYGADHVERLARIRALQAQGFSLAVIRRILDGELDAADVPLVAAVAGALDEHPGDEWLDADELAARAGVPRTLVDAVVGHGLLSTHDGRFAASDAELLVAGRRLIEAGLPLPDLLALAQRQHDATRAIAEEAVELFDAHVRQPLRAAALDDDVKAAQLVAAFEVLLPATTTLVAHHFRRVLLEVAQSHLEAVE